jgi:uncharacterized protein
MAAPQQEYDSLVRWLAAPSAYGHRPQHVEHVETHISHVFLAGPLVYKLKKPVQFDFLDFSTIDARHRACREELRLNRRLAMEAYIDVVPVTKRADGQYEIGGPGSPIDWLVQMRRLPTQLTLDALHRRGELTSEHINRLAETLVGFYRSLEPLPVSPTEYRERCLAHVRGNLRELLTARHHLPRGVVERVHAFQLQLLQLRPELVEQRAIEGRIVEGHGDLRPEHICLGEPVTIFDCIEFSRDLRTLDVADELAFLQAECDFLAAEWAGEQLLAAYQKKTGDTPPAELLDFYKSYRACVRAKVAALRADQVKGAPQQAAVAEAARHLAWADRYAGPWVRPLVLVVGGLAGSGKTTLAKALAEGLSAEQLRTDVVRQELFGAEAQPARLDDGIYDPIRRGQVYDELFRRAAALHADRVSVVLDGTFSTVELVRQANRVCSDSRGIFLAVECVCPPEIARERIRERLVQGRDASDARPDIYDAHAQRWIAWPSEIAQVRVDTTRPLEDQIQALMSRLKSLA